MDEAQWTEYRDSVITAVTATLDGMKPVADAMDVDTASFQGSFELSGDGVYRTTATVRDVPLFADGEPDQ